MPRPVLPEIRLQSPVQEPPGVVPFGPPMLFPVPLSWTPSRVLLGIAAVPVTSVPMKLPRTTAPVALSSSSTLAFKLIAPEMTLQSPVQGPPEVAPPMRAPLPLKTCTPTP